MKLLFGVISPKSEVFSVAAKYKRLWPIISGQERTKNPVITTSRTKPNCLILKIFGSPRSPNVFQFYAARESRRCCSRARFKSEVLR
jgi:hypothetical protein